MRKFIGIGLIFFIVSFVYMLFYGTPWGNVQAKREIVHYLENKYGEPFHVKQPRFWIMDGNFHAEASPAARPDLIFIVGTEQGEEGIQDSYLRESWRYEGHRDVAAIVTPYYKAKKIFVELYNPSPPIDNADLYAYEKYRQLDIIIDLQKTSIASKQEENMKIYQVLMAIVQQEIPIKNLSFWFKNGLFRINKTELLQLRNETELFTYWVSK
ncbi:hypothetical protein CSE16_13590 [Solibacillus sp. R5-41]|uniref:hypothetical protein n=1 Tax=Solibacillus sp. R5-41 TaxID=2048654 RepID=UPI000C129700|nr:hypothetical protein [Solibacillus sp. R5-41]ATP41003.1 hypothetical protein CSE16_13590 [Solibacillus sp. R5-41]